MAPWETFEHTADVGLRATGATLEEALAHLVVGFGRLVCPEGRVRATATRKMALKADRLEDLVVDVLDEVNYVLQTERFIPASCAAALDTKKSKVTLLLKGEAYDPARHGHMMEVKAATYHDLVVEKEPPRIEVIFDI